MVAGRAAAVRTLRRRMGTYERVADLPLEIERYELEGLSRRFSEEFERRTTVFHLHGGGPRGPGRGRRATTRRSRPLSRSSGRCCRSPAPGRSTPSRAISTSSTCSRAARPASRSSATTAAGASRARRSTSRCARPAARSTRRSAATPRPVTLRRLAAARRAAEHRSGRPPPRPLSRARASSSTRRPTGTTRCSSTSPRTGSVASIDFKGAYKGTPVDVPTDAGLYQRVAQAFPDAWLEDPDLGPPDAAAVLAPYRDRITWDAPIHSVADVEKLPFAPRTLNCKPSRFGPLRALLEFYDHCEADGIALYGGGQSELGRRPRADPVPRLAVSSRHAERHRAVRLGLVRVPRDRPGAQPARSGVRRHRLSPRDLDSLMPPKPRQVRIESKSALAAMERLQTLSDEELEQETRQKAAAQALLGARAAERMDAKKSREHFRAAIAAARPQDRLKLRQMAEASLALAERRAGRPQGGGREARPDAADEPPAADAARARADRAAAGLAVVPAALAAILLLILAVVAAARARLRRSSS